MGDLPGARVPPAAAAAFRGLVESLDDGLYTIDREGRFTFVNDLIARNSGFPAETFVGRSFLEMVREEDRERVRENFERVLSGSRVTPYELAYLTASGEEMWVEVATAPLLLEGGEIIGVLGVSHNIQRRKVAERALRDSETNYRSLVETMPHGVAILQGDRMVFANQPLARMFGLAEVEELYRAIPFDFLGDEVRDEVRDRLARRMAGDRNLPTDYATVLRRAGGEEFAAELHVAITTFAGRPAVQCMVTDISERLRMEEQIRHAQKMEAMGNLAGGIAHDFNNLLTGILATASLLRRHEEVRDAAELIEKSALQAAALTRQLLGFARKDQPLFQPTDVHDTIRDVVRLLERTLDKSIVVVSELTAVNTLINGDAGQLQQVFMNLFLNARDAMAGGGRIVVGTRDVEVGDVAALETAPLGSGRYLEVRVTDTGTGIPDPVRDHVFDPFFTTKPTGQGCGMGLAVAYAIVRNHNGAIRFRSKVGVGTTFTVHLPLWQGRRVVSAREESVEVTGEGTLLFVDDEEVLRETADVILSSLGYRVVTASSAVQALAYFRDHGAGVHLVILDLQMPGMNGEACFHALRRIDPAVRVLFSSGYGLVELTERLREHGGVGYLEKPYDVARLSAAVARSLSDRPASGDGL